MMGEVDVDQVMTIIGTIGGFCISLSLVPQVYLTYKTKCADDISYTYQFIYIFGASLVNAYAIYFELYAVYIPCLLELFMIITLTIMKYVYPPREDVKEISRQSIAIGRGTQGALDMKSLSMALNKMESIRQIDWSDDEDEAKGDKRNSLNRKRSSMIFLGQSDSFEHQSSMLQRKSITMMKQMSVKGGFSMNSSKEKAAMEDNTEHIEQHEA